MYPLPKSPHDQSEIKETTPFPLAPSGNGNSGVIRIIIKKKKKKIRLSWIVVNKSRNVLYVLKRGV